MKIKWYGHSAFLISSDQGVKIITDPYESGAYGGQLAYGKIRDQADIVLTSHDHADHNDTKSLPGSPQIIKGSGSKTVKAISFKGIPTYHDPSKGSERGTNTIFTFSVDGVRGLPLRRSGAHFKRERIDRDRPSRPSPHSSRGVFHD